MRPLCIDIIRRARRPAGGQAAPMTYVSNKTGRQYVVIAAGGHQRMGTTIGDSLVAYTLPGTPKPLQAN